MRFRRSFASLTLVLFALPAVAVGAANTPRVVLSETTSKGETRRWEITGPWGGDVRSMVGAPDDPDTLYLGTSDGQIFNSIDGAQTWRRLRPGLDKPGLTVDDVVVDSRDPQVLYAGTWAVAPGSNEQGVYRSDDAGKSWKLLKGTKGLPIMALAMAPSDSSFLIAGARSGVFRSTDAGESWDRISPENHPEIRNVNSAAIDPTNLGTIYIGTNHLPWKTGDGGQTWEQTGYKAVGMIDDTDIMGICVNPANGKQVYMNGCSGIYRSANGGEKWTKLPGIPFSARRTYALLPHPTRPEIIFAGTSEGLWRTKDGGKRWMLLTSKNVVIKAITIHPNKPDRVIIATEDFGVRLSENLGDLFVDANVGFIHRHVLAIMPDATERGRLLASVFHDGTADSVFASTDSGETWQPSSRGLGTRDVFAFYQMPDNPDVIYAGTNVGAYRSNDRGANWAFVGKALAKPAKPVRKPRSKSRTRAANDPDSTALIAVSTRAVGRFETTAAQRKSTTKSKSPARKPKVAARRPKPAQPAEPVGPILVELTKQVDGITSFIDAEGRRGLLAASMDGLYMTVDETKGWQKIAIGTYDFNGRVFSVATHPGQPGRILAGTRQGLFTSEDGGATWEQVSRGPNDVSVTAIAIDPRDPDVVLLGSNQFIYRSTNGGRTWLKRGGGLRAGDYTSVVFNPGNPDVVLASEYSQGGVYRSTDAGYSWERIDKELPSNRVWTVTFDPFDRDRMYAGSFSSGVYVLTIQKGVASSGQ